MTDEAQTQHSLPFTEAPASWNCRYMLDGFDCQLTLRDISGAELLKKTASAIEYLKTHGATPTGYKNGGTQAPPAPVGAPPPASSTLPPAGEEPAETIQVKTIAHAVTDTGHHYVKVKGGKYSKFGVKAWDEVIPESGAGWETWPIGQEFEPPNGMKTAIVQDKKVTLFR